MVRRKIGKFERVTEHSMSLTNGTVQEALKSGNDALLAGPASSASTGPGPVRSRLCHVIFCRPGRLSCHTISVAIALRPREVRVDVSRTQRSVRCFGSEFLVQ